MTDDDRDLRARLVAAGVELVATGGVQALGLREIARHAGVSHGAPRRYFPTHRELLAAIARHGFGRLTDTLAGADALAAATGADARTRIDALARAYLGFAAANPGMFELMFRHDLLEGSGTDLRRTSMPLFLTFAGLVSEVHPQHDDPTAATAALWSNLHGLAQLRAWGSLQLITGSEDIEPLLRAVLDTHLGILDTDLGRAAR
ncbi:TetR family transcriptional regulator [Streptomyces sp. 1114.5]|uniref:TetR/AcrR family transcriptional regulator n=1 Tax=unclassified Streptomyces TaxID=2593676 RepID=UPI000BCB0889|nr:MULTISPECIES: TetR/AcrR family transcriptional regulator [unclassified Streptomyces]RKT19792.1 TetR family transcriptional regulator [Streptomyces sp. 1114.5]SOB85991.1 transcriptional regulator, TetR family [Streptomyces sp. 1331.2]